RREEADYSNPKSPPSASSRRRLLTLLHNANRKSGIGGKAWPSRRNSARTANQMTTCAAKPHPVRRASSRPAIRACAQSEFPLSAVALRKRLRHHFWRADPAFIVQYNINRLLRVVSDCE